MALKTKQYLENSWYRGASQDRQTGYAAQYQYGYGVNTRDMKNGVCLAGGKTKVNDHGYQFSYFTYKNKLYYVDNEGDIYLADGTLFCSTGVDHTVAPNGIEFGENMYIVGTSGVVRVTGSGVATDITSYFPEYPENSNKYFRGYGGCVLNYANTFLLIGDGPVVWKMDLTLGTETFKGIRLFESSYIVFGLTQEGNYLKIYTSNGINTKIHYAKGTFDVEYTGLIQTVNFTGLSVNYGDITSDQGNDYAIFAAKPGEYKLAKISGYNKTDIRWTQKRGTQKIFTATNPTIKACDGIVFAAMEDGIWTFTEYNGWLWGGCCEFPIASNEEVYNMFRFGESLYACVYNSTTELYENRYYDLSFHPASYQSSGFLISRVFDGGCGSLFKKNVQATITYNMPTDTSMELSYRYDRSSFEYDKANFFSIKELTDTNECYDIIFPTTPGKQDENLLALENGTDNILLENGNKILLEDLLVCPFNKTWNYLEYRMDLSTTDTTKTPILFEHSLLYDDRVRKYR